MKQIFSFFLILCMVVVGIAGCSSSGVSRDEYNAVVAERDALKSQLEDLGIEPVEPDKNPSSEDPKKQDSSPKVFNEKTVLSQISVEEYAYNTKYWNYAFLVFKNNSEFDLDISVNVDFFDKNGALIGAKDGSQEAFGAGTETILYFMPDEKFEKLEYEISVAEEKWYECVVSDLSYEVTEAKDKIILAVTNNAEKASEFVEGNVLFFKGKTVVGFDHTYFTDDSNEIKPGKTIKKELDCYEKFDSVKIYLSGRR